MGAVSPKLPVFLFVLVSSGRQEGTKVWGMQDCKAVCAGKGRHKAGKAGKGSKVNLRQQGVVAGRQQQHM